MSAFASSTVLINTSFILSLGAYIRERFCLNKSAILEYIWVNKQKNTGQIYARLLRDAEHVRCDITILCNSLITILIQHQRAKSVCMC